MTGYCLLVTAPPLFLLRLVQSGRVLPQRLRYDQYGERNRISRPWLGTRLVIRRKE